MQNYKSAGCEMLLSSSINIKTEFQEQYENEIYDCLETEFSRISNNCYNYSGIIHCDSINASFGSILRTDKTHISVKKRDTHGGYVVTACTEYKPSCWFWLFFVIDILLIETIIGFIAGMAVTLGLYFYNKNLVVDAVKNALQNVKNKIE